MTTKLQTGTMYHVFTDNTDEWTPDILEANRLFDEFVSDTGCARLYQELHEIDGECLEEDCLRSKGRYPS